MRDSVEYVLRRAAAQYRRDGVLAVDTMSALDAAGLVIEDVINHIEENA